MATNNAINANQTLATTSSPTFANLTVTTNFSNVTQPGASVYVGSQINDVTGDGTNYQIVFDTALFNTGTMVNLSTGLITFPVTGKYLVTGCLDALQIGVGHTAFQLTLQTTAKNYSLFYGAPFSFTSSGEIQIPFAQIVTATATNTGFLRLFASGSTKTIDVGTASAMQVWQLG